MFSGSLQNSWLVIKDLAVVGETVDGNIWGMGTVQFGELIVRQN